MPTFSWGAVAVRPSSVPSLHIVVPKKVFPRAVDRNRVTRRIRAALQKYPRVMASVRIYPREGALQAPFALLVADLARALE